MPGTEIPDNKTVKIGEFELPSNYNPEHDPRVKKSRDDLLSRLSLYEKQIKEFEPTMKEFQKQQEEKKSFEQRYSESVQKVADLENWKTQVVKKAKIESKITDKLTELLYAGTKIVPQFINKEELFQIEDVDGQTFADKLKEITDRAFVQQTIAYKELSQPIRPAVPGQTPGAQGSPMPGGSAVLPLDPADIWAGAFGSNTVVLRTR